jgi:outer membrane lipoprotein-sorting protein
LTLLGATLLATPAVHAQEPSDRARLHQQLQQRVSGIHSLSWLEEAWERKGSKTETSRERGTWSKDGPVRLEVLAGRGKGAVVTVQGDAVTVQLPSMLKAFKRHYRISDPAVRSLRGHSPAEAGFMPDLAALLQRWDTVNVRRSGREVELVFPRGPGLVEHIWLSSETLVPSRLEIMEGGGLVERKTFQQVALNPPRER